MKYCLLAQYLKWKESSFWATLASSVIKAGVSLKSAVAPLSCIKMTLYVFTWSV